MRLSSERGYGCLIILIWWGIWALLALLVAQWTDRNLDFWFSYFRNETVDIPFWLSFVVTWFLHLGSIFINIIMELGRYAVA